MENIKKRLDSLSVLQRTGLLVIIIAAFYLGSHTLGAPQNSDPTDAKSTSITSQAVNASRTETTTESVPYTSSTVYDSSKSSGSNSITTPGVNGVKTITWTVNLTNGVESGRTKVSEEVTTQPVNEVITKVTYVAPTYCPSGTYVNTYGNTVCRPYGSPTTPSGASAICRDGTYSFSKSRSGTCSHHGGVAQWL